MHAQRLVSWAGPVFIIGAVFVGCNVTQRVEDAQTTQLVTRDVEMGVMPSGGTAWHVIKIQNPLPEACTVQSWDISCECVTLRPTSVDLRPNGSQYVAIVADHSSDPDFSGDLAVMVRGFGRHGEAVIEFRVHMSIVDDEQLAPLMHDLASRRLTSEPLAVFFSTVEKTTEQQRPPRATVGLEP